ncbi:MAG: hypothetical protein ACT4QA_13495 [Panacagrimonas sp.]
MQSRGSLRVFIDALATRAVWIVAWGLSGLLLIVLGTSLLVILLKSQARTGSTGELLFLRQCPMSRL